MPDVSLRYMPQASKPSEALLLRPYSDCLTPTRRSNKSSIPRISHLTPSRYSPWCENVSHDTERYDQAIAVVRRDRKCIERRTPKHERQNPGPSQPYLPLRRPFLRRMLRCKDVRPNILHQIFYNDGTSLSHEEYWRAAFVGGNTTCNVAQPMESHREDEGQSEC
jgi:hypothetical protein